MKSSNCLLQSKPPKNIGLLSYKTKEKQEIFPFEKLEPQIFCICDSQLTQTINWLLNQLKIVACQFSVEPQLPTINSALHNSHAHTYINNWILKGTSNGADDCSRRLLVIIYSSYQSSLNHLWKSVTCDHTALCPHFYTLKHTAVVIWISITISCIATSNPPIYIWLAWKNTHYNKSFILIRPELKLKTKGVLFCYSHLNGSFLFLCHFSNCCKP